MATSERIETYSKFIALLSEFMKLAGIATVALFVISALLFPDWMKFRLEKSGFHITDINAGIVKLVAVETVKANGNVLQIAEALTKAEISLNNANAERASNISINNNDVISRTLLNIKEARAALDMQSTSIISSAKAAGAIERTPSKGWLYVGYFDSELKLLMPSPRIANANGIRMSGEKVLDLVFKYDAPIVSDGDNCTIQDITQIAMPDPTAPEREFVILRASTTPVSVLATSICPAHSGGKHIYAQIEIPNDRVRFSKLSLLRNTP